MMNTAIQDYLSVQNIGLRTLNEARHFIKAGVTERDIAEHCALLMRSHGVKEWWYHNLPALVLAGERSILSVSGRHYTPSDIKVREGDLVTIDLGPQINGYWGDCARSYGMDNPALEEGIATEKALHDHMRSIATPTMTLHELYVAMNAEIEKREYENLDFKGNLGHSIEKDMDRRRYIEAGNITPLKNITLFTFEPHIRKKGSRHGFKRENIYYFENGKPIPLGDPELLDAL